MNSAAFSDNLLQIGAYLSLDTVAEDLSYQQQLTILPPGGTPYDSLYEEALLERGTFFLLQVYECTKR